jgi:adenylate cyclase
VAILLVTLLAMTIVLGVGLGQLSQSAENLIRTRATEDAENQAKLILEALECYSEVVSGAQRRGITPNPEFNFRSNREGIPHPFAFLMELTERLGRKEDRTFVMRIYSDWPWLNRARAGPASLDAWEKEALGKLRADPTVPVKEVVEEAGGPTFRYAAPLVMKVGCVNCHNTHPNSPKQDWRVGDVRGVQEVIRPLAQDRANTRKELQGVYALLGGEAVGLLALSGLALLMAGRRRRLGSLTG